MHRKIRTIYFLLLTISCVPCDGTRTGKFVSHFNKRKKLKQTQKNYAIADFHFETERYCTKLARSHDRRPTIILVVKVFKFYVSPALSYRMAANGQTAKLVRQTMYTDYLLEFFTDWKIKSRAGILVAKSGKPEDGALG